MATEGALNLPTLTIDMLKETTFHFAAVTGGGPFARSTAAFDGYQTVCFEFLADHDMKRFGVATGIPKNTPKARASIRFSQHDRRFHRVTARTDRYRGADKKMRCYVDTSSQFGPARNIEVFTATTGAVVMRGVAHLEAGAVARDLATAFD